LALDVIDVQAQHFVEQGLSGVFICGTTGEGLSLSVDERKLVAARWADVLKGSSLSLWIHVGANALPEVKALSAHASVVGADAVALMPPVFYRPASEEALVAWCSAVASVAGGLPLSFYESPETTGVHLDMERFVELARSAEINFCGLKFTDSDQELFARLCSDLTDGEGMWWGRDEELRSGIRAGATGAIGSTYNFAAPVYEAVLEERRGGDPGRAEQSQSDAAKLVDVIAGYGYLPAAKAVMGMLDVHVGPARMPLGNLDEGEVASLRAEIENLGFFDWVGA
jgi:N-acetylneuraminate lyase